MTERTDSWLDTGDRGADDRRPAAGRIAFWLACMALLLAGFALMGHAFDTESALEFLAGVALSGLAFVLPLQVAGTQEP